MTASSKAWSLASAVRNLDSEIDVEGRPISERRATPEARRSVAFDVAVCEYGDERDGYMMNVSALAQITAHLKAIISDIRGFRGALGEPPPSWDSLLVAVVDQLAGPAVQLILDPQSPVSAQRAVGHKLAAGYYGVVRDLLAASAQGREFPVSSTTFLDFIAERNALIGASEACAGPPKQIAFLTHVLLGEESVSSRVEIDPRRPEAALRLATEVRLGIAWELFDEVLERSLLRPDDGGESDLFPRNAYVGRRLAERLAEMHLQRAPAAIESAVAALPPRLGEAERRDIGEAFITEQRMFEPWSAMQVDVLRLLELEEGAVRITSPQRRRAIASATVRYCAARQCVVATLERLEREVRGILAPGDTAGVAFGNMVLPRSRCQEWLEVFLGYRLRFLPAKAIVAANHRRKQPLLERTG